MLMLSRKKAAVLYYLVEKVAVNPSLNLVEDGYELKSQIVVDLLEGHRAKLHLRLLYSLVSAIDLDSAERWSTVDNHYSIVEVHSLLWVFSLALHKLVPVLFFRLSFFRLPKIESGNVS